MAVAIHDRLVEGDLGDGGPLGAFECAWLGLACRTGIKPRHLIHAAYVTRADVGDWLQRRYGFNYEVADVHYRETYDRLQGRIAQAFRNAAGPGRGSLKVVGGL